MSSFLSCQPSLLYRTHDEYLRHFLLLSDGAAVLNGQDHRIRRSHERTAVHRVNNALRNTTVFVHN